MKKYTLFLLIICLFWGVGTVQAEEPEAGSAAMLLKTREQQVDKRPERLRLFLAQYNSPMTDEAELFVSEADRLGLDWRLVAAIAGVESTFGRFVPTGSYNGWGWGIPTGASSGIGFRDWKDGIRTVSVGLKYNYVARGAVSIEQIGRIYAASPMWATKVRYFIDKIDAFEPSRPEHLAISL